MAQAYAEVRYRLAEVTLHEEVDFRAWLGQELKVKKVPDGYGSFAEVFPALAAASAGWENRPLRDLRDYFAGSAPSDRSFELLGAKISINGAASAACLAVVCFQIVLLGFLRELKIRLAGITRNDWPTEFTLLLRDPLSVSATKWLVLVLPPLSVLVVLWSASGGVVVPANWLLSLVLAWSLGAGVLSFRAAQQILSTRA